MRHCDATVPACNVAACMRIMTRSIAQRLMPCDAEALERASRLKALRSVRIRAVGAAPPEEGGVATAEEGKLRAGNLIIAGAVLTLSARMRKMKPLLPSPT